MKVKEQLSWINRIILFGFMLIAAMLIFAGACHGQSNFRKHIAPGVLVFLSGAFEGTMDHLQFHYDKHDQFWNPDISWVNKYRNHNTEDGLSFRGKYFVFTTDGWHLMKFGRNATMFAAFTFKLGEPKKKWHQYIVEAAAYWAVNRIGFNATYKLLK